MILKKFVAASLIFLGIATLVIFIGGLVLPSSLLLKFSKDKKVDDPTSLLPAGSENQSKESTTATATPTQTGGTSSSSPSSNATPASSGSTGTATAGGSTSASGSSTGASSTSSGGGTTSVAVAPSLTFSASPTTITSGSNTLLSWSINSNATATVTCTASSGWSGSKTTSNSEQKTPSSTTTYTLSCSNSAGTSTKSVTVTVNAAAPTCGNGGSCSLSNVQQHNTSSDCWVIIAYTASGGNGTGKVYKLSSGFFGSSGSHNGLPGAPSLSASSWCGKNITSTFNNKHSGGSRSDGTHDAIWWLTNNSNSYIANWSGS